MVAEQEPKLPITQALELSKQFGGIAKIPEDELTRIGYYRPDATDLGHIALLALKAQKDAQAARMAEQATSVPFGRLELEVPTRGLGFRFISWDDYGLIADKTEALAKVDFKDVQTPSLSPQLDIVRAEYEHFIRDRGATRIAERTESAEFIFNDFLLPLFETINETEFGSVNAINRYKNNSDEIPSTDAQVLFDNLERAKGRLTDTDQVKNVFKKSQTDRAMYSAARYVTYGQISQRSPFQRIRDSFSAFLRYKSMDGLADALEETTDVDQALQVVEAQRFNVVEDLVTQEKEVRQQLKTTTRDDRETLIVLNQRLKALEARKRQRRTLVEGIRDYYHAPELVAQFFSRKIKEIQDLLVFKGHQETTMHLILDGNPDAERDSDPGVVSGDCTAGSPLPFADPNIPVHNIKVLTKENNHIGNIYLLVTSFKKGKGKVWHLEAVQIPQPRVDWRNAIPILIEKLATEAEKQNVEAITVNSYESHISNYDYIRRAISRVSKTQSADTVVIPKYDIPDCSNFQGDGYVDILWEKDSENKT